MSTKQLKSSAGHNHFSEIKSAFVRDLLARKVELVPKPVVTNEDFCYLLELTLDGASPEGQPGHAYIIFDRDGFLQLEDELKSERDKVMKSGVVRNYAVGQVLHTKKISLVFENSII